MTSSQRVTFDPKRAGDTVSLVFDFISKIGVNVSLSSPVVTVTVWSGVDASPGSILSGAASTSGSQVTQKVTAGVAGVIYQLKCQVNTSDGQVLSLVGLLFVSPDGP